MSHRSMASAAGVVLAIAGFARADERFWFIQDGAPVDLVADGARLGVVGAATPGARAEAFGVPGWSIVREADGARAGGVRAMVADALADPGVAFVSPVFAGTTGPGPVMVTTDILVRFRVGVDAGAQDRAVGEAPGASVVERDAAGIPRMARVRVATRNGLDVLDAANLLAGRADVEFAEPDFVFTARGDATPDDPDFPDQWALRNTGQAGGTPGIDIGAADAFDTEDGDPFLVVVVLDTGVDTGHPDLNLAPGADFTTDPVPGDGGPANGCDRHGTWVAGCIAAVTDNGIGIAGAAGHSRVASARIGIATVPCDGTWSGQLSWTASALDWAGNIGARVTNNSNAYPVPSVAVRTKYEQLRAMGVVHFASTGNDGVGTIAWPATLDAVQAMGSIGRTGMVSSFSNFGAGMRFVAPGEQILTTDRVGSAGGDPGDYIIGSGTSFCAPYGASVAALVASVNSALDAPEIEDVLVATSVDLGAPGYDTTYGYGLVDARGAVALAACASSWSPTGVSGPSPRADVSMAYDSGRGAVVMFGGATGVGDSGETWEHTGAGWVQKVIAGPGARHDAPMAFDAARGVTVVFGGVVGGAPAGDTWEYDGVAWALVSSTGPSARSGSAIAFDAARGVTVLFGGATASGDSGETWEWDGNTWTEIVASGPSARHGMAMVYDATRGEMVAFGGSVGAAETWVYDGAAHQWTQRVVSGPGGRKGAGMAFDARTDRCVVFGGESGGGALGDTWDWDGTAWRVRSLIGPGARRGHAMVFRDSAEDSFEFGGFDASGTRLGDSWTWYLPAPTIFAHPADVIAHEGDPAMFSVQGDGIGVVRYQWRRDGMDVADGAGITGAATDTLAIDSVGPGDFGAYSVVVTDACGASVSMDAALIPACAGDITGEGNTNASDFNVLALNFGTTSGATRADGDLTGDGAVNSADFNVLAGDFGCVASG